jgi:hypothetical protein
MQGLKQMLSWLFGDLFYWLAIIAVIGGVVANVLALMVGFIPTLKPHAFIMKVVGIILIILGGYYVADHRGYQRRVDEDQAEIERLNGEARAKEAELNKKITQANTALKRAKDDIQSKQASLNARADVGELRLPSTCGVQTNPSSSSVGGNQTPPSESERQTIKALIAIASDGDTAITSLNACINQYNEVMKTVNEGVK